MKVSRTRLFFALVISVLVGVIVHSAFGNVIDFLTILVTASTS